jgi:hypothetical protein
MQLDLLTLQRFALMASIPLLLYLLPIKLGFKGLVSLAFLLWFTGSLVLLTRGTHFLTLEPTTFNTLWLPLVLSLSIGYLKGKLILGKAATKNLMRLANLPFPQKPIAVYPLQSWITIGIMIAISLLAAQLPNLWRAVVCLGIGAALLSSSMTYLKALANGVAPPSK